MADKTAADDGKGTTEPDAAATAAAAAAEGKDPPTPAGTTTAAGGGDTATADAQAAAAQTDDTGTAAAEPAAKAPEKYELTVPEGDRVTADDLAHVETAARAAGWSNEQAQAYVQALHDAAEAMEQRYLEVTTADPEYGGDKLAETQKLARRVINAIRPEGHARRDSFLRFLNRAGTGNHIEVVSFLADLGKRMSEDSVLLGSPSAGQPKEVDFYDHPTSKALEEEISKANS